MMQNIVAISIVAACLAWMGVMAYRYLRPKPGGKACAGGCCDGADKKPANQASSPAAPRTQMISSDDLRNRLAARKS